MIFKTNKLNKNHVTHFSLLFVKYYRAHPPQLKAADFKQIFLCFPTTTKINTDVSLCERMSYMNFFFFGKIKIMCEMIKIYEEL